MALMLKLYLYYILYLLYLLNYYFYFSFFVFVWTFKNNKVKDLDIIKDTIFYFNKFY